MAGTHGSVLLRHAASHSILARKEEGRGQHKKVTHTKTVRIRLSIRQYAVLLGIKSAYALWKQFGGSKSTTAKLWKGDVTALNFDTMEKLCTILRCDPVKLFSVEEIKENGETWEAGYDKSRAKTPGGESEWSKSAMNLPALNTAHGKAVRKAREPQAASRKKKE